MDGTSSTSTRSAPSELGQEPAVSPVFDARHFFEKHRFLELLRQMASMAKMGVWEVDLPSFRTTWSTEVYRIHELPPDTAVSFETAVKFYPEDAQLQIRNAIRDAIELGQPYDLKLPLITAKGRPIWVHALGAATMHNGSCVGLFGAFQDITAQKVAEDERLQYERRLRHGQKLEAVGTVAGGVAHEFNNILGGIMGSLELIQMQCPTTAPEIRGYAGTALDGCRRAAQIIRQMLSFSRDEPGERAVLDLRQIIRDAMPLVAAGIPATAELQTKLDGPPLPFFGDRSQIYQVLMNLVSNAVQALPNSMGTVKIETSRVTIDTKSKFDSMDLHERTYVTLAVRDSGCGIDDDIRSRVFDPFFTTKEPGHGTGLGLSVVHGIVRSHLGAVEVHSSKGQGSTFMVFLPEVEGPIQAETPNQPRFITQPGRGENVLVVDDEPLLGDVMAKLLALAGYVPSVFSDPREALRAVEENSSGYDVAIVDYSMPYMTGNDFMREVRTRGLQCPIILTTGTQQNQISEANRREADVLLPKPASIEDILKAIAACLKD